MRGAYDRASIPNRLRKHSENCVEKDLLIRTADLVEDLLRRVSELETECGRLERIACA